MKIGTVEQCRQELMEVMEEWLIIKIRDRDPIPQIEGITLEFKEEQAA